MRIVHAIDRIHRFLLRIPIDTRAGGAHTIKIIVLQIFPRSEYIARGNLPFIKVLYQASKVSPGVSNAALDGRLHFRGKIVDVHSLPSANSDFCESRHEFLLRRMCRAELQQEAQDVEELGRSLLGLSRERLNEIDALRGVGCGVA